MRNHVGEQLGNYRVLRLVGRGGSASVYLGEHVYLKSPAALKILHAPLTDQDTIQFLTEAQTLARLTHPHIVRVLDFAVQDGIPFLVMEYSPDGSLRKLHPTGTRVPLETIVAYVQQVASALQHAHDQRLLHRDVKPENMLRSARFEVLLSDFGLALFTPHTLSMETQAMEQSMTGTTPYLAPEQLQGKPRPASDQYALGVVVYEWLCGRRPFSGSPIEIAMQHLSTPPAPLREHVPALPPAVEEVVLRALGKEPRDRFASVQDFASALQGAWQEGVSPHTLAASAAALPADHPGLSRAVPTEGVEDPSSAESVSASSPTPSTGHREEQHAAGDTTREPLWRVPSTSTPLVGREQDVAALCAFLSRPEVRFITLVGTGGIGKTRLSIAGAVALRESFAEGACFVELAPISDPDLVLPSIATALGIQEEGVRPIVEQVKAVLRDKQLLLILDNFEQVITAAPQVADLLAACPQLKVLATSREVLHLQAEHLFPVSPLALPDLAHLPEHKELAQYAAVALFLQRAEAILPGFQMTSANARAIAEICVRLDGLPLAIGLAAARVRLLPPQALLARLSQRLAVLTGGARDAPVRQQTLRNTLAWSYDLLDAVEQRLFRRLSVFVGGCTLEAIEAVCTTLGDCNGAGFVLDSVASLIDKSLLQQTEQEGEELRLALLETIREYGLEALEASGEMEVTRQAHAAHYLRLVELAEQAFDGPQQAAWLERLEREHDNLRAALRWSLERGEAGQSMELAMRLGSALWLFWLVRGHSTEGRTFLERALAGSQQGVAASVRAKALGAAAGLAFNQDDMDRGEALCQESLALHRELGDAVGIAASLYKLGLAAKTGGNFPRARSLIEEAQALWRQLDDRNAVARSLVDLAYIVSTQGDYAQGRALFKESLALFRELGDKRGIVVSLREWAETLLDFQDDPVTVRSLLEESLMLARELGDKNSIAFCFSLSAQLALSQGDAARARSLFEEGVVLFREIGNRWGMTQALSGLARVEARQGDYAAARALYEESLAIAAEGNFQGHIARGLDGLASVVATQGERAWAARLWGAAEFLRETIGVPLPPVERASYEQAITAARTQLGEEAFVAAWAKGSTLSPERVLATQGAAAMPTPPPAGPPSTPSAKPSPTYPAGLTTREVEVLRLVAQGLTDAKVAEHLVISPRTVNWHLTSIYSKLQVTSRSAATRYAIEHKLV
jgi:predicted ATPase/serine/threonine protein kinase/DNA-binding CsgD family transcriptional regulator